MRRCIPVALMGLFLWFLSVQALALSWVGNTKLYLDGRLMPTRSAFIEKWQTITVVCQTYPIEPGQHVYAGVTTNRWQSTTQYEFTYDYNVGNNSQWYLVLGPFPPGTEVDFYVRAEGPGGPFYDNNSWQNYGFVSRMAPTSRDGAILQWFQTDYKTIMLRLPEVVRAGYSAIYLPGPQKSGGGGFSAGYNPFDRFDLGDRLQKGTVRTAFGTTQELLDLIAVAKRFGIEVYCDLVLNHSDNRASTAIDRYPDSIPEDFHIRSSTDTGNSEINFNNESSFSFGMLNHDLVGLVDIAQEDGNNTRTGTFTLPSYASFNAWNKPSFVRNPLNPQYYANSTPVAEDVRQYLRRWCWWLTNVIGFDGFRLDAVKHMPPSFFDSLQGQPGSACSQDLMGTLYAAKPNAYVFGEDYTSTGWELREYAKTGIQPLDFPLRFKLNDVFNAQGFADLGASLSNMYSIDANTGLPYEFGGLGTNVGVGFVQTHDDGPPQSNNMAHAFVFTRPGRSKAYYDGNNIESNDWTHFPKPGRYDSLGQGDDYLVRILDAKKRFARGVLVNRWVNANLYIYERQVNGMGILLVGLNDRGDLGGSMIQQVQTAFAPGQVLEDLTGQQPNVTVDATSRVTITVPSNTDSGNNNNARGYVLYAPVAPKALVGYEPVTLSETAALPFQIISLPSGVYATPGSFKAATVVAKTIKIDVLTNTSGYSAFAKLDSGLPIAGRQPLIGTQEGLTDGFVSLDKLSSGVFRLANIDVSGLQDGLHLLKVRVFTNASGRPPVFSEFPTFFYVRRGLPSGWAVDGDLSDMPSPLTSQTRNPSSNSNRLDALYATNDDQYLYLGVAGRVDTNEGLANGFSLWLDTAPGGLRDLSKLNDDSGPAPRLLSNTKVTLPASFGAEFGIGVFRHSHLGSSPETSSVGLPVLSSIVGAQAGLYQTPDVVTTALSPKLSAIAYQPRPNRTDPPKGAEIVIPLRELYGTSLTPNAQMGLLAMLTSTGETGSTLAASDPNRATLGGRPAPAAWLSNQILPSQINISSDWGTNPITLLQSTTYTIRYAATVNSGYTLRVRVVPTPRGSQDTVLEVTVTNTGVALSGPINLVANVAPTVEMVNRTNMTLLAPSRPYVRVSSSGLPSGGSETTTLTFRSSSPIKPTFSLTSGPGVF